MCWGFEISDWEMFDTTPVQWRWMTFHYFCSRPSPEEQRTHCQDWKSCDVLWPRKAFPHTQPLQNTQLYNSEEITLYNLQFKPLVPKKKKKGMKSCINILFSCLSCVYGQLASSARGSLSFAGAAVHSMRPVSSECHHFGAQYPALIVHSCSKSTEEWHLNNSSFQRQCPG